MATEAGLVNRLATAVWRGRPVALVLGSGVTAPAVPDVAGVVELADRFVSEGIANPDLAAALARVRADHAARPVDLYAAYRRTFTEWVSPMEFDIVMQQAVLQAHRPPAGAAAPGRWERIGFQRGAQLEADLASWVLPPGVRALGNLLAPRPASFGHRVLTTNFDPLIEIAVRRAGGRARSLPLRRDGSLPAPTAEDDAVTVVHLHGYWRPTSEGDDRATLHDPERLRGDVPSLARELSGLLRDETICVVGCGGGDDALAAVLHGLATDRDVDVLWAHHGAAPDGPAPSWWPADPPVRIPVYHDVDSNRLFPELERVLHAHASAPAPIHAPEQPAPVPALPPEPPATIGGSGHRIRHTGLERLLGARPSADELLRQLDLEFGWRLEGGMPDAPPSVLYWPVQLRQPTLIHTVQALIAAALSARGMVVLLCFDDLSADVHPDELRRVMRADVLRWFRLVEGARPPMVESLASFCEPGRVAQRLLDPAMLVRPTHPWAVERDYYRHSTLYDLARTIKAIPDADADDADPVAVKTGLTTTRAERLWSPPAIWAYLHYLLLDNRVEGVVTLGGDDEATMWRLWHEVFADPVRHLYNPRIVNLRQDAGMLRCNSFQELKEHLDRTCELPTWRVEGHYLHWIVQNVLLLSQYLRNRPPLSVAGRPLDSWPAVVRALDAPAERPRAVQAIAREVSALFLGERG
ncbi:SIR2 family protein [Planosporangium sp. 12N6]|uniref:SIR2 family protein n=1 Tax=Planosporangium spinosum TaxID=3402278 RepID=UPI003CFB6626